MSRGTSDSIRANLFFWKSKNFVMLKNILG